MISSRVATELTESKYEEIDVKAESEDEKERKGEAQYQEYESKSDDESEEEFNPETISSHERIAQARQTGEELSDVTRHLYQRMAVLLPMCNAAMLLNKSPASTSSHDDGIQ